MRLAGKRCLVTGAARGIGYAIAEAFVREGARVLLTDKNEAACRSAAAALNMEHLLLDVSKEEHWAKISAHFFDFIHLLRRWRNHRHHQARIVDHRGAEIGRTAADKHIRIIDAGGSAHFDLLRQRFAAAPRVWRSSMRMTLAMMRPCASVPPAIMRQGPPARSSQRSGCWSSQFKNSSTLQACRVRCCILPLPHS